jgi:PiT family inorganic phosphate transporter
MPEITLVIAIIVLALGFDFVNGFHDAANSIATVVSTRVLTPFQAVIWAAVYNFIVAFTFGTAVAHTIVSGLIDINSVGQLVIQAGLVGAIAWDLITWRIGLPTSSSHALIGGYAGVTVIKAGFSVMIVGGWIKTLAFIIIAPLLGWFLGTIIIFLFFWFSARTLRGVWTAHFVLGSLFQPGFTALVIAPTTLRKQWVLSLVCCSPLRLSGVW